MSDASDRIRTLLLRADNVLKNPGDGSDRQRRAREALDEAAALAESGDVDERVRALITRRLEGLDELTGT